MALEIAESQSNGVAVLKLSGRVTLGDESRQLRNKIKEVLGAGKNRLVLDLSEVRHIDSAGLGTLVSGYTSAQSFGANIKLANLSKKVSEQLNVTKLVTVFEIYNTLQDAVKSFGP